MNRPKTQEELDRDNPLAAEHREKAARIKEKAQKAVEDMRSRYAHNQPVKEPEPISVDLDKLNAMTQKRREEMLAPPVAEEPIFYIYLESSRYFVGATAAVSTNPDTATRVTQNLGDRILRRVKATYPAAVLVKTLPVSWADTALDTLESVDFDSPLVQLEKILQLCLEDRVPQEEIKEVVSEVLGEHNNVQPKQ